MSVRGDLLRKAAETTEGARAKTHGTVRGNMNAIASAWTWWLTERGIITDAKALDGVDVAQMMSFLKKTRSINGDTSFEDHYLDDAAYVGIAYELSGDERE